MQDGESLSWETSDAFRLLNISQTSNDTATVVHIVPHAGGNGYIGEPTQRQFEVELLSDVRVMPSAATVNGAAAQWRGGTFGPNRVVTVVVPTGVVAACDGRHQLHQRAAESMT